MADESRLYARLADAHADAARAHERIAQAFAQLAAGRGADEHPGPDAPAPAKATPPAADRKPPVLKLAVARDGDDSIELKPASLRILAALYAAKAPLSKGQICVRAGLTYKSGSTDSALAELRAGNFITTDSAGNQITDEGAALSDSFPELPTGHDLFELWLTLVGGRDTAPGKVLLALRAGLRDGKATLGKDEICEIAALTYKSGSTDQALAKVRKLELVVTLGARNQLHPDLREALEPTIAVFDTKTGQTRRVKAR